MKTSEVLTLYDSSYAEVYDDRFIFNDQYKHVAEYEVTLLRQLLATASNWLDVGCGTGYFLSKFPDVPRAGLDLSADMLGVAKKRNQNALFLQQGDFRHERPQWEGQWDLVSCMWCAYSYVESVSEIDRLMGNLAAWTSDRGFCFLPLCDLEDVLYWRESLQHSNPDIQVFGGPSYVNAVVWSYVDNKHGKRHENLISPHIEYLIKLFEQSFHTVQVVYYPPYPRPIPGQRKALLAAGKSGAPGPEAQRILQAIDRQSQEHRRNVLSMEALEAQMRGRSAVASKGQGWLRRAWQASPRPLRRIIRRLAGES